MKLCYFEVFLFTVDQVYKYLMKYIDGNNWLKLSKVQSIGNFMDFKNGDLPSFRPVGHFCRESCFYLEMNQAVEFPGFHHNVTVTFQA